MLPSEERRVVIAEPSVIVGALGSEAIGVRVRTAGGPSVLARLACQRCPACSGEMDLVGDVVEEAVEEALVQGCRVEVCVENADLDVVGGIGALLRF